MKTHPVSKSRTYPLNLRNLDETCPVLEVNETRTHFLFRIDVNSMLGDDILIELNQKELTLTENTLETRHPLQRKRVSVNVDSDQRILNAHYTNGFLLIRIEKTGLNLNSMLPGD